MKTDTITYATPEEVTAVLRDADVLDLVGGWAIPNPEGDGIARLMLTPGYQPDHPHQSDLAERWRRSPLWEEQGWTDPGPGPEAQDACDRVAAVLAAAGLAVSHPHYMWGGPCKIRRK